MIICSYKEINMNKMYLLILLSSSILICMKKNRVLSLVLTKPKNVSFSNEAMDRLALTQELIMAQEVVSSSSISRTRLSTNERYPVRPELSPDKISVPHRGSVLDVDGKLNL